jgi:hypothetical protein
MSHRYNPIFGVVLVLLGKTLKLEHNINDAVIDCPCKYHNEENNSSMGLVSHNAQILDLLNRKRSVHKFVFISQFDNSFFQNIEVVKRNNATN